MNVVFGCNSPFFNRTLNRLLMVGLTFFLFSTDVFAGNLNLAWNASASANVGGYKLFYGQTSNTYTSSIDVGNLTSYQLTGLTAGATYFVALKTYNSAKTTESGYSNEVSAKVSATATLSTNFTANKTSGAAPLVVSFTPTATGAVTAWKWNFGTASIPVSSSQIPTVTYVNPGTYSVSLTATGPGGNATAAKSGFITVTAAPTTLPPLANFSATPTSGIAPITVSYTDTSTGNIASRLWSFGDGSTSTTQNPTHTYSVAGIYTVSLKVTGTGGSNTITKSSFINVASNIATNGKGLVAAYSFEEIGGTKVADASSKANHGIIKEAIRVSTGRHGKALKFDGVNDWVTVNDSPSLDLSSGLTLESWVYPQSIKSSSVLLKEQVGGAVYNLYPYEDADLPISSLNDSVNYRVISGPQQLPINQWTHLASTYDGLTQRLYVNGIQVATRLQTGLIKPSTGALRIGGNSIWGEYFHGLIDDVRIYNRALTKLEVQNDLKTAVSVSNPPKLVVGNKILESSVDSNPQGIAEAFKVLSQKNSVVTAVKVYLDAGSTATELVAGIYNDNTGHPGKLLAQGKLNAPKAGATNSVAIPAATLLTAKPYWIAILGSKGQIKFRDRRGSAIVPMETSVSGTLTTLPSQWMTGVVYPNDGPMSVYGTGY